MQDINHTPLSVKVLVELLNKGKGNPEPILLNEFFLKEKVSVPVAKQVLLDLIKNEYVTFKDWSIKDAIDQINRRLSDDLLGIDEADKEKGRLYTRFSADMTTPPNIYPLPFRITVKGIAFIVKFQETKNNTDLINKQRRYIVILPILTLVATLSIPPLMEYLSRDQSHKKSEMLPTNTSTHQPNHYQTSNSKICPTDSSNNDTLPDSPSL